MVSPNLAQLQASSKNHISRLALKIVVMTREQGTGNREQKRGFGRFYFSLHITLQEAAPRLRFFSIHLLSTFISDS